VGPSGLFPQPSFQKTLSSPVWPFSYQRRSRKAPLLSLNINTCKFGHQRVLSEEKSWNFEKAQFFSPKVTARLPRKELRIQLPTGHISRICGSKSSPVARRDARSEAAHPLAEERCARIEDLHQAGRDGFSRGMSRSAGLGRAPSSRRRTRRMRPPRLRRTSVSRRRSRGGFISLNSEDHLSVGENGRPRHLGTTQRRSVPHRKRTYHHWASGFSRRVPGGNPQLH